MSSLWLSAYEPAMNGPIIGASRLARMWSRFTQRHAVQIALAIFIAALPVLADAHEFKHNPKAAPKSAKTHSPNPCAKYGPGFIKLAGSDTCLKIGGSIDVEAGGSGRR